METAAATVAAADALLEHEVALDRRPFVDRYYTKKYFSSSRGPSDPETDYMLLVHSNKLTLLTLAPSHPIVKQNLTVVSVNFKVSEINRTDNVVIGKWKKGGQMLGSKSPVCTIETSCGKTFLVRAGLTAKLLEVNDRILLEPELLKKEGTGYIAILSPKAAGFEKQMKSVMSAEEYLNKVKEPLDLKT